jgi:hypothetical protein
MCGNKVNQEIIATMNGSSRQTPHLLKVVPDDMMASSITTVNNSRHENRRKLVLHIIDDVLDLISDDLLDSL